MVWCPLVGFGMLHLLCTCREIAWSRFYCEHLQMGVFWRTLMLAVYFSSVFFMSRSSILCLCTSSSSCCFLCCQPCSCTTFSFKALSILSNFTHTRTHTLSNGLIVDKMENRCGLASHLLLWNFSANRRAHSTLHYTTSSSRHSAWGPTCTF